jgi:hypothetical protein
MFIVMHGLRCVAERTSTSKLVAITDAETKRLAEAEEDDDTPDDKKLHFDTKEHLGWRVSYRRSQPEYVSHLEPVVRKRLQLKMKHTEPIAHLLGPSNRHNGINVERKKHWLALQKQRKAAAKASRSVGAVTMTESVVAEAIKGVASTNS